MNKNNSTRDLVRPNLKASQGSTTLVGRMLAAGLLFILSTQLPAQEPVPAKPLEDALLEKLVGDWNVERKFGNGGIAQNVVHVEWVLQHQFLELHYRDLTTPPRYEARVLVGYDHLANRYIAHWADVFGGAFSTDGFAVRDEAGSALDFKFEFHDGPLTNRYAFDPTSGTWTSTIRQAEKGEWKLFCEDKFTRSRAKETPHPVHH